VRRWSSARRAGPARARVRGLRHPPLRESRH